MEKEMIYLKEYDKNNNPIRIPESNIVHNKKWRAETAEEFRKVYGAWWIFNNVPIKNGKKTWIEQYRKGVKNNDQ